MVLNSSYSWIMRLGWLYTRCSGVRQSQPGALPRFSLLNTALSTSSTLNSHPSTSSIKWSYDTEPCNVEVSLVSLLLLPLLAKLVVSAPRQLLRPRNFPLIGFFPSHSFVRNRHCRGSLHSVSFRQFSGIPINFVFSKKTQSMESAIAPAIALSILSITVWYS